MSEMMGVTNDTTQGGAVQRSFLALSLIALLIGPGAFPSAHAKEPQAPAPLPIEQMRAVAYTQEFAKRFAHPDPEPGTEPSGGMQAMEFAVETSPNAPYYYCKFYLYLDDKLPIAYPEGETGVAYLPSRRTQLMTFDAQTRWLRLSEKDRLHFNERKGRYNMKVLFATTDYQWRKRGASVGMFYEEYHRNLFPGVGYIKIDMACPAYSWIDKVDTAQIWLAREGAKDYRLHEQVVSEDFLKFTIPQAFYHKIIGWTKETARYNREVIDQKLRPQPN